MNETMLKQRIKYLVEAGGLYPHDPPVTRPLLLRVVAAIVLFQLADAAIHIYSLLR